MTGSDFFNDKGDKAYRQKAKQERVGHARAILRAHAQALLDAMETVPMDRCPYCKDKSVYYLHSAWRTNGMESAFCHRCGTLLPERLKVPTPDGEREGRWVVQ